MEAGADKRSGVSLEMIAIPTARGAFYCGGMTLKASSVAAEILIDEALATRLLSTVIPPDRGIALEERYEGRDYVTWRFARQWAMRIPRRQLAADRQVTETVWLAHLAKEWQFATSAPAKVCPPSADFPWTWSIVPWLDGSPAAIEPLCDQGALELGWALRSLHQAAPANAPTHPLRSQSLATRAPRAHDRIATLHRRTDTSAWRLDAESALRLYTRGASIPRPAATWCHLDLRSPHVLVAGGRLAGIIDWGDAAAADPATDIGQVLTLLPPMQWDALAQGYGSLDVNTFERARAEAIDFAVGMALSPDALEQHGGWAALVALGVAKRAS